MINEFRGKYRFLSNFNPCAVKLDGVSYRTVEHAYQAAKTLVIEERLEIHAASTPLAAKHLGNLATLRPGWESLRVPVMDDLLRQKFRRHDFRTLLLRTGDECLEEGNYWHDRFWGVCHCRTCGHTGDNHLGKLIMAIRKEHANGSPR